MSEFISNSADQAIFNQLAQIDQPVQAAIQKACDWSSRFVQSRLDDVDVQGLCLALFSISCALKSSAPDRQPQGSIEITERLLEKLLDGWDAPDGLRAQFEAGSFITPLMAAAALVSESPAAKMYRQRCQKGWLAIERSNLLTAHPALLLLGRQLARVMGADEQFADEITQWRAQFSNLTSKYIVSAYGIQQMLRELAALSLFGQVVPPISDAERNYLMDALPFWAFFYIKERDLDMVCPLVRALNYMKLHSVPEYGAGLRFILQQSKANGRFGMQEMAIHLQSLAASEPIDAAREIYLPLTVASVWTLVECLYPAAAPFRPQAKTKS